MNDLTKKIIIGIVSVAVIAGIICLGLFIKNKSTNDQATQTENASKNEKGDGVVKIGSGDYTVDIKVENYGTITVELDKEAAPITVDNFIKLVNAHFYNTLTFHRIMSGFMIQGGDPKGDGTGGSEETIKGEFSSNGVDNPLSHTRGAISMARSSEKDSASSQFFIVHEDSTFLDGEYAVFGYVSNGMNVVDKIAEDAEPTDDNGTIPRGQQPVIESITIRE